MSGVGGAITPPAAVLFDCDGVLADTEAMHNRILAEEITALGWPMDAATCQRTFLGLAWEAIQPHIEAKLGPGSVPPSFIVTVVRRVVAALEADVPPIPGVMAALAAIQAAGIPVAVASNSSRAELVTKLRVMGLDATFGGRAFCVQDVDRPKPAPDMYLRAAEACGVDPARCVVVEDSVQGSRAGMAAGARVLGFAPHGPGPLDRLGIETFADMRDLPRLIGITP